MGAFSIHTRAGIFDIIFAMENSGAKIKVPTTGVFDFPSLILGGKGKCTTPLKEIAFSPLRRKRGFGIMVVLNLSAAQMWFCEFPQAARPGSQTARKRGFATTS